MTNQLLVDLLTRTFAAGALPHPGDEESGPRTIPLPGFRATGMPEAQAEEMIGQAAKMWAEAIEYAISTEFEALTKADAAQLRQDAADAPDGTRIVTLYDQRDHQRATPLWVLTVGKTDDVSIDVRQLRKFLAL